MSEIKSSPQNTLAVEPRMLTVLDAIVRRVMVNLASHHVATIQSFDKDKQTVTASINYKKRVNGEYVDYPLLVDCPVIILRGGGARLTFPIEKGEECIMLFNDRCIDGWFQTGQAGPLPIQRFHSLADGFALIGVSSLLTKLEDYDDEHAVLSWGTTRIGVSEEKALIENNAGTLNDVLQDLVGVVKDLATSLSTMTMTGVTPGPGVSGPPTPAADFTAAIASLTTIGTTLGGLLE